MIISSGYNMTGPEVEVVLLMHPAVRECGVVGTPDPAQGQIGSAFVVLEDGYPADGAMVQALRDTMKAEVAPRKYPRRVVFVPELPRTGSGKLQRFALRHA